MFYEIPQEAIAVKFELKEINTPNTKFSSSLFTGLKTLYCKITFKLPKDIELEQEDDLRRMQENIIDQTQAKLTIPTFIAYFTMINHNNLIINEIKTLEENPYLVSKLITSTLKEIPLREELRIGDIKNAICGFDYNICYQQYLKHRINFKKQFPYVQLHQNIPSLQNISPFFCMHIQLNLQKPNPIAEDILVHNEQQYAEMGGRLVGFAAGVGTLYILRNENWKNILYGLTVSSILSKEIINSIKNIYKGKASKFLTKLHREQKSIASEQTISPYVEQYGYNNPEQNLS